MDFNLFEIAGKTTRRIAEGIEDAYLAGEEVFCTKVLQGLLAKPGEYANDQACQILGEARYSLKNNDIEEATHQLERELYFTSILPVLKDSPNRKSAQAGLDALKKGASSETVQQEMEKAFMKALLGGPRIPEGNLPLVFQQAEKQ
jgi:hypothetical protein